MAGLGRGLSSLISDSKKGREERVQTSGEENAVETVSENNAESAGQDVQNDVQSAVSDPKNTVAMINIEQLVPSVYQPRKVFDDESIAELALSIKEHGVLEPLLVKKIDDKYNIICGERRYRASMIAGLSEVPCLIRDDLENDTYAIALIDNIQREDLNPIEMAEAFSSMINECSLTQEELAKTLGKSRSTVTNILRLNNLQEDVKKMVVSGQIDLGHAKVLLALEEGEVQLKAALYVIKKSLNVRQTEELVKDIKVNGIDSDEKQKEKKTKYTEETFKSFEESLKGRFSGLKVKLSADSENKGKLTLAYSSREQLEELMKFFGQDGQNQE